MNYTYDLLHSGGIFEVLYSMNDVEDVELIRMVENEFIKYYIFQPDWNVVNKKKSSYSNKEDNIFYKNIKISEEKYIEALQILVANGLINESEVIL